MPSTYWMTSAPILAFPCQAHHQHACTLRLQLPRLCCTGRRDTALGKSPGGLDLFHGNPSLLQMFVWLGCVLWPHTHQEGIPGSGYTFFLVLQFTPKSHFVSDAPHALLDQVNFQPSNALPRIFIALIGLITEIYSQAS